MNHLILLGAVPVADVPLVCQEVGEVQVREGRGGVSPGAVETTAVAINHKYDAQYIRQHVVSLRVAAAEAMGTTESNGFPVSAKSQTLEHGTDMISTCISMMNIRNC